MHVYTQINIYKIILYNILYFRFFLSSSYSNFTVSLWSLNVDDIFEKTWKIAK